MKLICLGSSSHGNCYILKASNEVLIIECGLPMIEVKKALKFDISNIAGCIVSHQHRDHSKYLPEFLKCGIRVLALEDVFNSFPTLKKSRLLQEYRTDARLQSGRLQKSMRSR